MFVCQKAIDDWKDEQRAKKTCRYAKQYKAKRKPTCGCAACLDKWNKATAKKIGGK